VEIECLATALPEFISVDLGDLVKGKSLHVSDLKFPAGIKAVRHGTQNPVVVSVVEPKVEEEAPAADAAAAPAAPAKGKGGKAAPAKK
jgi:large subunit ribosomal protein L25